ncbi:hypothetical protein FB107DRAFT_292413 [Schizophyllum commune]
MVYSRNGGDGAPVAQMPSSATHSEAYHQQLVSRPLRSHYEQMLPLLHVAMHTNIFHTEHEDYPFWATAFTWAVEKYMKRIGVVVPQAKLWSTPHREPKLIEEGNKATTSSTTPNDPSSAKKDDASSAAVSRTDESADAQVRVFEQRRSKALLTRITATLDDEYTPDAEYDSECNLEDKGNSRADAQVHAALNKGSVPSSPSPPSPSREKLSIFHPEEEEQTYDLSLDSIRTTDTGARKKVITDFGVLIPRFPNKTLDHTQVYSACAELREGYSRTKTVPHGVPSDFVPQFRSHQNEDDDAGEDPEDEDWNDDDSDDDDDDDDDEYQPNPPIVTPSPCGFKLRPRTPKQASTTSALSSGQQDQSQADCEALSWLDRDMVFDDSDSSPHDEVCNTARAFKKFESFAEFYIAILCEGKRSPSRANKKGRFTKKIDVWDHQHNVVGVVMFERIPGRTKVEAKWQDYTDETRPFRTCNPWTLANMMERVNQLYPAFSPSPTVDPNTDATPSASETLSASGSSGPTAVATPADAPSSADAPGSANLEIPSGQPADTGEETRTVELHQETHATLDFDVTMHEPELAPNAADLSDAPSARTPSSRLNYQTSEIDDGPPPFMANVNAAVIGSGPDSRRLCEEGTRATFNDSTVIGLDDDAGPSGDASPKPPDGKEIQGHAQDVSTHSAPLRTVDGSTNGTINSRERWRRDTASVQPRPINAPVVTTETGSLATPSAPPGVSASTTAVPLAPRMHSRDFVRTATQDLEPDSGPTGLHTETGDNGTNNRDGQTSTVGSSPVRKSLYGQNTQAALDGLAAISISNNESTDNPVNAALGNNGPADVAAVPASVNPAQDGGGGGGGGGNGSGGTGAIPVNPDNPLKRSEPDDPDEGMGAPRAAKKAKRAPAVTEPPAQAGPGPSTQHARGKAAPKRVRKKVTVQPSTLLAAATRSRPRAARTAQALFTRCNSSASGGNSNGSSDKDLSIEDRQRAVADLLEKAKRVYGSRPPAEREQVETEGRAHDTTQPRQRRDEEEPALYGPAEAKAKLHSLVLTDRECLAFDNPTFSDNTKALFNDPLRDVLADLAFDAAFAHRKASMEANGMPVNLDILRTHLLTDGFSEVRAMARQVKAGKLDPSLGVKAAGAWLLSFPSVA